MSVAVGTSVIPTRRFRCRACGREAEGRWVGRLDPAPVVDVVCSPCLTATFGGFWSYRVCRDCGAARIIPWPSALNADYEVPPGIDTCAACRDVIVARGQGLAAPDRTPGRSFPGGCDECRRNTGPRGTAGPSHNGSRCRSGSIASGGTSAHCTCDTCF